MQNNNGESILPLETIQFLMILMAVTVLLLLLPELVFSARICAFLLVLSLLLEEFMNEYLLSLLKAVL